MYLRGILFTGRLIFLDVFGFKCPKGPWEGYVWSLYVERHVVLMEYAYLLSVKIIGNIIRIAGFRASLKGNGLVVCIHTAFIVGYFNGYCIILGNGRRIGEIAEGGLVVIVRNGDIPVF